MLIILIMIMMIVLILVSNNSNRLILVVILIMIIIVIGPACRGRSAWGRAPPSRAPGVCEAPHMGFDYNCTQLQFQKNP